MGWDLLSSPIPRHGATSSTGAHRRPTHRPRPRERTMKTSTIAAILAAVALLLCAPGPASAQSRPAADAITGHLLITGSSTTAPLVSAIAKRFQVEHPGVSI